jgi:hypothetical protein
LVKNFVFKRPHFGFEFVCHDLGILSKRNKLRLKLTTMLDVQAVSINQLSLIAQQQPNRGDLSRAIPGILIWQRFRVWRETANRMANHWKVPKALSTQTLRAQVSSQRQIAGEWGSTARVCPWGQETQTSNLVDELRTRRASWGQRFSRDGS